MVQCFVYEHQVKSDMKISRIEPFIVHVPLKESIADSTNSIDHWGFPGVILHADNGIEGIRFHGYTRASAD